MTRRQLLKTWFNTFLVFAGADSFIACNSRKSDFEEEGYNLANLNSCDDVSGLSESEKEKRKSLGYTEITPIDENVCGNCQLYLPPKSQERCGGCQLFKGPVYEQAYCTYWAPRAERV